MKKLERDNITKYVQVCIMLLNFSLLEYLIENVTFNNDQMDKGSSKNFVKLN